MLTKLFEAIDSEILTDEMKSSLKESFDTAVETKAAELVLEKIQDEKQRLDEEYKESINEYKQETDNRISEYLDLVVEHYLTENEVKLDEMVKVAQADALLEGFDALLIAGGVSLQEITENTDDSKMQKELSELTEKVNTLVESNNTLKEKNKELIQLGLIKETAEGLSLVEAEKFTELAEVISIDEGFDEYLTKLNLLKESVKFSKDVNESSTKDDESKDVNESTQTAPTWSKFL